MQATFFIPLASPLPRLAPATHAFFAHCIWIIDKDVDNHFQQEYLLSLYYKPYPFATRATIPTAYYKDIS